MSLQTSHYNLSLFTLCYVMISGNYHSFYLYIHCANYDNYLYNVNNNQNVLLRVTLNNELVSHFPPDWLLTV